MQREGCGFMWLTLEMITSPHRSRPFLIKTGSKFLITSAATSAVFRGLVDRDPPYLQDPRVLPSAPSPLTDKALRACPVFSVAFFTLLHAVSRSATSANRSRTASYARIVEIPSDFRACRPQILLEKHVQMSAEIAAP